MSYIGNPIVSTDFPVNYFSGNGSTTAFTLSIAPASVNSIDVQVSGVSQSPQTYSVSGTTLTFTAAPPTGSSNIVVRHLGIAGIPNTPSAASVSYSSLDSSLQNRFDNSNKIINGCMRIDQRNAGASVTSGYPVDRWQLELAQSSKLTAQQNAGSVTPPAGFSNYLGITSSSAYSVTSTDYFLLTQRIEGFNTSDLQWGTANAKTITLSFQVYSSLTGTFSGAVFNGSTNRGYVFQYTVSSANTWTPISVTISGDTSGTWNTTNGMGVAVRFCLGSGSARLGTAGSWGSFVYDGVTGTTSVVGTSGATFYITGVDLRKGSYSTAPTFDMRQYGQELALCQRYAIWLPLNIRGNSGGSSFGQTVPYSMRTNPSFSSPVADPSTSQASLRSADTAFVAGNSGQYGGYLQLTPTASGDAYYLGYRSLATAEL